MTVSFEYFSPANAGQYAFFRIPKLLITDNRFRSISMEAKLLYGILLDRVSLSMQHGWVDENDHVYIIYTIEQIMTDMNCGNRKAVSLLKELDKLGIEREKARQKKEEWEARFKDLDRRYKAQENMEINSIVHSYRMPPDELAAFLENRFPGGRPMETDGQEPEQEPTSDPGSGKEFRSPDADDPQNRTTAANDGPAEEATADRDREEAYDEYRN